jgi:hypothetical protein
MPTQEIFRHQWKTFFDNFTRYHQGWMATVQVFGQEIGAQEEIREMPFGGIVAEMRAGCKDCLEVILGENRESHISHTITEPTRIRLESEAMTEVLQIESASKHTFLLSFHHATALEKTRYGALVKSV